jgi:para-nitrobenzyl esterase
MIWTLLFLVGLKFTPTPTVKTDTGELRGLVVGEKGDVHAYKGIPYAAAPVGDLRWKPPQPAPAWQGVRDCFEFGAACPQNIPTLMARIPQMATRAPFKEDCLFLNIWAPAKAAKLPVLYWIHGGGFVTGAASQTLYDGEELARLGCVVVSVNYRLGLFGFLAHPALSAESPNKVSGNYGLLDQIEGLRWVKRNIASFGGDPEHVAIFGESAGGISVLSLMVMPEAKGLFQGAIAQSATAMNLMRLRDGEQGQDSAEQVGQRLIEACGLAGTADAGQMRHLDADKLVNAFPAEIGGGKLELKPLALRLGPIVDGQYVPDSPNVIFAAGHEHAVPVIIGNTRDEMSLMLLAARMPADKPAYLKTIHDAFGGLAESIAKAYPAKDAVSIRQAVIQFTTDLSFTSESRFVSRTHSAAGQKAYRYQFSLGTGQSFLRALGAHHGAELAFVFQHPARPDDSGDVRTSRTLGHYWINFAATGNPNGEGLAPWPAYKADSEEMIEFAQDVNVLKGYRNEQLDVIEKILRPVAEAATTK